MSLRVRLGAALLSLAAGVTMIVAPAREAHAWVDVHVEADDVHVTLEKSCDDRARAPGSPTSPTCGDARIEHKITLKIAGGPLRSIDLRGVDADAVPDPEGYVVPQREAARGSLASAIPVTAERLPPDARPRPDGSPAPTVLRVRFDRERGLGRGVYVLFVRYATHLAPKASPNSALTRIEWRGLIWDDGFDSARATFDLPAAPTEPRADDTVVPNEADGAPRPPLVLSTLRRTPARDQIELFRPYAPKSEAITWAIRADARALSPAPAAPVRSSSLRGEIAGTLGDDARRAIVAMGALALFVFYSVLVARKAMETARFAREAGTTARPLVPIPTAARSMLAGAALVGGLFVQMVLAKATIGALLVVAAVALASHRTPRWPRPALRGPGRWLPIAETAALAEAPRPRGAYLDVSTRAGKAIFAALLAAVAAFVVWFYDTSPHRAELAAFDAVALLAIFCTGRLAELPPDPAKAPARMLRAIAKRLHRALPDVRLVGRIRVPEGSAEADELRLAIAPRTTPAGFGAIEIGVVYAPGPGGAIALPEVILRVTTGSPCEEAVAALARHGRSSRGRRPNERAILFSPRLPTARMTAGIAIALVRAVTRAKPVRAEQPASRAA